LRIGYVCSDLTMHPVGLSIRTLLLHHDKSRFEIILYDRTPKPDKTIAGPLSMGADVTRRCVGVSSEAMANMVQDDGIDILVDLSGAVIGSGDTVFSRLAAPARVAMIGYPGAMGFQTVDYTVVDSGTVPAEQRQGFSERLIVMPESFLPLDDDFTIGEEIPSRQDIGLAPDAFVMAAFNRLEKVNVETLRLWVACLKRISRAVLWMASDTANVRETMEGFLERAGLSSDRVVVSAKVSVLAHARRHGLADVSLDPLGYNGGYSTALALQCGVPVVSRPGRCFAWRMSVGLLHQAGLADCVVETPGKYLAQVIRIAADRGYADQLRGKLAPAEFALAFQTRHYVETLERAFLEVAAQGTRGEAPSDIIMGE
jgi:predicted O-linked N-acetylglucosamine transferase (SPINDLY family)